jgi:hypothetical protein
MPGRRQVREEPVSKSLYFFPSSYRLTGQKKPFMQHWDFVDEYH